MSVPVRWRSGRVGSPVTPGHVSIAAGSRDMSVQPTEGEFVLQLSEASPETSCSPSVDVRFRSRASVKGAETIAVMRASLASTVVLPPAMADATRPRVRGPRALVSQA